VINELDSMVIPALYRAVGRMSEGLIAVCKEKKYGYVNVKNISVISAVFDEASTFKDGKAGVAIGTLRFLINKKGQCISPSVSAEVLKNYGIVKAK
jgi:hypothetical protein